MCGTLGSLPVARCPSMELRLIMSEWPPELWAVTCPLPTCEESTDLIGPPLHTQHQHTGQGQVDVASPLLQAVLGPAWLVHTSCQVDGQQMEKKTGDDAEESFINVLKEI